ncbi:precorrin-8X methylmutase [Leptothermofonsia sichuanensis]|uniref:precorrin-8X methylmutase n=1 Tax=Leptothermofonsia sichuanensis TaxID=2917832 RepID=UPI001CED302B|nr:precorrin-8X methylmutase [Leptothermofonsia sichuanensis]
MSSSPSSQTAPKFTIKALTQAVGQGVTPRMVRHYHQIGLLPQPARSEGNYRLYSEADVQRRQRIMALKQQGFQLAHIQQMLAPATDTTQVEPLVTQLQQQYQALLQQLVRLRQTATALEGLLGRDFACQSLQAEALAQLRLLDVETQSAQTLAADLWQHLDGAVTDHPEDFQAALRRLLPDLSERPEIELDVLSQMILACGDVGLSAFVRFSPDAIKAARQALTQGCTVVGDVPAVVASLDQPRLVHLGCRWQALLDDVHIDGVVTAEQSFWQTNKHQQQLEALAEGNIWVVGYAPSVLMALCEAIASQKLQPALVIGLPIGFSHAPAAKRWLMQLAVPYITTECALGGGLLAAVALNRLSASLIEKPDCHCYLG